MKPLQRRRITMEQVGLDIKKIGVIVGLSVLLVACGDKAKYESLFKDPQTIQYGVASCQSDQLSAQCMHASVAEDVMRNYVKIQRNFTTQYNLTRGDADTLAEAQESGENVKILPEYARYAKVSDAVQSEFAKLIMKAESNLVKTTEEVNTLKALKNKTAAQSMQLANLTNAKIRLEQDVIAMHAFLNVTIGGGG